MFKHVQQEAAHILPQAWTSHNHISISYTFRHTHTHVELPARNLFDLSTLEREGDRTGPPQARLTATVMEAMALSLGYRHMKTPDVKESSQLCSQSLWRPFPLMPFRNGSSLVSTAL